MTLLSRRQLMHLAAGAAVFPALSRGAHAQSYPARPVTLIVFVPAGGAPDILARLVGQSLSQRLGQAVVIDNRPGGGGNLALQAVARAPADGYTLLLVATPHAVNVTLYEKSNLSVTRDIVPVAGINTDTFVMLVNPAFPARTVAEFVAYAKANPGKINLASSGTGNLSHLTGELFRMTTGIEVVHVPYKGTVPALAGLMAGEVHVMFDALPSSLPHIQSGASAGVGRHRRSALAGAAGHPADRRGGRGLRRPPDGSELAPPRARRPRSSRGSTRRSTPRSPIPK